MKRRVQLSWLLLEHKYRYYIQCRPVITDFQYDHLEKEYEALCEAEGVAPTAVDMVGFDLSRRSCQIVAAKVEGMEFEAFQRIGFGDSKIKKRKRS